MEKYPESHTKFRVKTSQEMAARIGSFLRKACPRKTAESVSAETGISSTTISTWLEGSSVPGGVAFAKLIDVYGARFLVEVLPSVNRYLSAAAQAERQAVLEAEHARIERELAELRR